VTTALALVLALGFDALTGEPKALWSRVPHPAVLMGRLIGWCDRRFNTGSARRLRGAAVIAFLVLAAGATGAALTLLPGWVAEVVICAVLLAQRSLADHVAAVAGGLRQSPKQGRAAVAMIVSRDTARMEPPAIARSAIESGSENLSDGVIAPAFWFLIAGLPGLLVYKLVNTADSMIGYRTPRHEAFGWAAARLDDLLNLVPARLTAALIRAVSPHRPGWRQIAADAALHRSPNAGWPEAAMAVALDVAISGPRSYHGRMTDYPWVWPEGRRELGAGDIDRTVSALWRGWAGMLALVAVIALI
jgi:adenosylcobinamide-phosphate synthase